MNIEQLMVEVNRTAREKGWYDPPKTFGEVCLMFHTEASEIVEEYRKLPEGWPINSNSYYSEVYTGERVDQFRIFEGSAWGCLAKPEGVAAELADLIIRVLDTAQQDGIDLVKAIREKMEFNATRPFRHGGKRL
ncbi:MAG: hypothetical protein Q8P12_04860 [bacterium]|nr:hypothetical protein [bacterium]